MPPGPEDSGFPPGVESLIHPPSVALSGIPVASDPFVFSPDSEMWRINRQRCGLFFGPAAAILQVAHPRIAQGVYDHSQFRTDTLGRLERTLQATNRIAFGRQSEADAVGERLAAVHQRIQGTISPGMPGSTRYSAAEPDLLLWVLATLIVAAVEGYQLVYGPLPNDRKENFYRDMRRFGTWFGVPESDGPPNWTEFDEYYQSMISRDLLGSHALCAEVSQAIVHPRDSSASRVLGRLIDFLPIETLPTEVRKRLGFRSTRGSRAQMRLARRFLPFWFPRLPDRFRFYPEYQRAMTALDR